MRQMKWNPTHLTPHLTRWNRLSEPLRQMRQMRQIVRV